MTKKTTGLNVHPETRDKLMVMRRQRKRSLKPYERSKESVDDVLTRLLNEYEDALEEKK